MPRTCTVCKHPKKRKIEGEIFSGTPLRKIATIYGLSTGAVNRHKLKCVSRDLNAVKQIKKIESKIRAKKIKKDQKEQEKEIPNILSGISILETLNGLADDLTELRTKAEGNKQYTAAISAVKEQIRMTENLMKRAEELMRFEAEQKNDSDVEYKEDLPDEINQLLNTILNDPDLEADEVEGEYSIVSEN